MKTDESLSTTTTTTTEQKKQKNTPISKTKEKKMEMAGIR